MQVQRMLEHLGPFRMQLLGQLLVRVRLDGQGSLNREHLQGMNTQTKIGVGSLARRVLDTALCHP